MELARIQAEQAARAAEAEAAAENTGEESDGTAREEADT
jgi:hypothetical protein